MRSSRREEQVGRSSSCCGENVGRRSETASQAEERSTHPLAAWAAGAVAAGEVEDVPAFAVAAFNSITYEIGGVV